MDARRGYSSIAEKRRLEMNAGAAELTPFMQFGDTIRIEMAGADCKVEVPSASGSKSITTTTCANSVASGALKGVTNADPYALVQVKGNLSFTPSYNVPNFHRIVVHGAATPSGTDKEYVKLTIDPGSNAAASENAFGPFSWARIQP